jgi:hypothetical protein
MKNFTGGVIATVGACLAVYLLSGMPSASYPQPYDIVTFLLVGGTSLSRTAAGLGDLSETALRLIAWAILGLLVVPFSKPGWNLVRSCIWAGAALAAISLASTMLLHPEFWSSPDRNVTLLVLFLSSIASAQVSLLTAVPGAALAARLTAEREAPPPSLIETVCECGARFKSNPLMCSECGRVLRTESKDN